MPIEKMIQMILDEVHEDLLENNVLVTLESQAALIESWLQDFEEVPPRNRLEKKLHNALQGALDTLLMPVTSTYKI